MKRSFTVFLGDQIGWVVPTILSKAKTEARGWLEPRISKPLWQTERAHCKRGRKKQKSKKWTRALFFMLTWRRRVRIRKHDSISKENLESFGSSHR